MGYSYNDALKKADEELIKRKKEEEIEMLEETIRGLTEDTLRNGLTEEQMFLVKYYGLNEEELADRNFNISNIEQKIYPRTQIPRGQLETNRYEVLIDIWSAIKDFNSEEVNKYKDSFHREIKEWDDYTRDFDQDTLIVKKMRNLQMLNRVAHQYETILKSIIYRRIPKLEEEFVKSDRKNIEYNIEEMFSIVSRDAERAEKNLVKKLGRKTVDELKNNEAVKYCVTASRWMFKQKNSYILEIVQDLQNSEEKYNYGILEDAIVFDVPKYGQFGIHYGKNGMEKINELRQFYGLEDYKGDFLGNVYILSKADPELLKDVNYEELSEQDKQRYRIASSTIGEKTTKEIKQESLDKLIENSSDKEKSLEIVKVLENAGLNPEELVTRTLLEKGNPDAIKDVIEVISKNDYGIGLDILPRCKTLLSVSQIKAIDVMEMLDTIKKLDIDFSILDESPNFLTVSKSDKLEPIYNVLKQYKIDMTNHNLSIAFEGSPQNIKKNLDLVIENGLYDFAKSGTNKLFTSNNKNLNMRINLLRAHNSPLVNDRGGKRKLNSNLFKSEKYLKEKYGVSKEQILSKLSQIRGQEFIKDSRYYMEEEKEIHLTEEQQEMSKSIYDKLNQNLLEQDIVIKMGDYFYSAIKVKEQIDGIISGFNIQNLENENIEEILKIALLKNKNITQKEVEETSKQVESIINGEIEEEKTQNELTENPQEQVVESEEQEYVNQEDIEDNDEKEKYEEEGVNAGVETERQDKEESEVDLDNNSEYSEIRKRTISIVEKQENVKNTEEIIEKLKEERRSLKHQIREMEEKINRTILDNEEPTSEIIQDIQKMREIIQEQKEERKIIKQIIKKSKENKREMKSLMKQEKNERDSGIDNLER